jgi:hypothetical protein
VDHTKQKPPYAQSVQNHLAGATFERCYAKRIKFSAHFAKGQLIFLEDLTEVTVAGIGDCWRVGRYISIAALIILLT